MLSIALVYGLELEQYLVYPLCIIGSVFRYNFQPSLPAVIWNHPKGSSCMGHVPQTPTVDGSNIRWTGHRCSTVFLLFANITTTLCSGFWIVCRVMVMTDNKSEYNKLTINRNMVSLPPTDDYAIPRSSLLSLLWLVHEKGLCNNFLHACRSLLGNKCTITKFKPPDNVQAIFFQLCLPSLLRGEG